MTQHHEHSPPGFRHCAGDDHHHVDDLDFLGDAASLGGLGVSHQFHGDIRPSGSVSQYLKLITQPPSGGPDAALIRDGVGEGVAGAEGIELVDGLAKLRG